MCELPNQHALCNVVSGVILDINKPLTNQYSHASIPAATRAARGLPEDLIRLCVGIEDSADLLDDLERALFDAGAIRRTASGLVRVQMSIGEAVQKLAEKDAAIDDTPPYQKQWVVSAPGKVILFGEHAVVYGIVSLSCLIRLLRNLILPQACFGSITVFTVLWYLNTTIRRYDWRSSSRY